MKFDIIIIGAGPAGLLAAWCLEGTGISYTVIEKGNVYFKRDKELPYDVSYGFGGAGLFRMVNFLIHQLHLNCGRN